jgi:anti-sigma regulatory factor (Ser/Thr protein kinase)
MIATTSSTLHIDARQLHGVPVMSLSGRLDVVGAAAMLTATSTMAHAGAHSIVCDLSGMLDGVTARMLTVFPAAQRRLGSWPEYEVALAGASPTMDRALRRVAVDQFLSLHSTLAVAVRSLRVCGTTIHHSVPLDATPAEACRGRHWVDDVLRTEGSEFAEGSELRETAALVTSELTANALRHVHRPFTLSLALSSNELLVSVRDVSSRVPALRPMTMATEGGRGLHLIDALSTSWGVRRIHRDGKSIWSRMAVAA